MRRKVKDIWLLELLDGEELVFREYFRSKGSAERYASGTSYKVRIRKLDGLEYLAAKALIERRMYKYD